MDTIKQIFLNPEEKRLRAGWRVSLLLAIWFSISLPLTIPALIIIALVPNSFFAANVGLGAVQTLLAVWIGRKLIDRRSISSLGLEISRQTWQDILVGIGIAGVQMLAIYLIEVGAGWLTFEGFGWQEIGWGKLIWGLLGSGVLFLAVGFYEELFSRGYLLQNLEEGSNLFWAVLLSSGFFGLIHILNPGATWISSVGVGLAGRIFCIHLFAHPPAVAADRDPYRLEFF